MENFRPFTFARSRQAFIVNKEVWAYQRGVKLHFIEPGKPIQNAFVESFNGKMRDGVPERALVRDAGGSTSDGRGLEEGLQRGPAA